ncbi:MAG TPA: FAD-dependent monooxygenase [Thermoanaerobaculia bacterium]|nr:FAD-dependent monooxygenase [Thermoanaerobaculia bacterium]
MSAKSQVFDVLVAGGGPAGAATARALALAGWSTVVLDASGAGPRAGETVPPEIRPLLAELGLWEKFLAQGHLPSAGNLSVWGGPDLARHYNPFHPYGTGWHLDRSRFDALLASAAQEAGADLRPGCRVVSAQWDGKLWQVTVRSRTGLFDLAARCLADATGRSAALVRRLGGKRRLLDGLVARMGCFSPAADARPVAAEVLVEAVEEGWWYSAPVPGGPVAVAFFTDAGTGGAGSASAWSSLEQAGPTRERLRGYAAPPEACVRSAASAVSEGPEASRFLAVGDAALAFDPLSSQGILKGLESGLAAAAAFDAELRGRPGAPEEYRAKLRHDLGRYLELRAGYYGLETRWPASPFWRARQRSVPHRSVPSSIETPEILRLLDSLPL